MEKDVALEEYILKLEKRLLDPKVRGSDQQLKALLDEAFIEFCSSGRIYIFNKEKVIDKEEKEEQTNWKIIDFNVKKLDAAYVLATYKLIKKNKSVEEYSLRSSIWKQENDTWKMIFHQGTKTSELLSL